MVQLYTYVDFPLTISNRADVKYPLVVQLVQDRPRESRSESEVKINFGEEVEYVDVVVRAPGFEEVSGYGAGARDGPALRRTIAVPQNADSQPAVFLLQLVAGRTGPQWVTVDFYHRGRNVGSLTLEVDVRGFQLLRNRTRAGRDRRRRRGRRARLLRPGFGGPLGGRRHHSPGDLAASRRC